MKDRRPYSPKIYLRAHRDDRRFYLFSRKYDGLIDSATILGLVFILGWIVGIVQASSWTR